MMKKIFTLCFFAFAMVIGTQSATAQSKAETNEKAVNTAKKLQQLLQFDDATLTKVYEAYREYNSKTATIKATNEVGTEAHKKNTKLVQDRLMSSIKNALNNEALYNRYLIATDQPGAKVDRTGMQVRQRAAQKK
jgi:hypothetical protein